MKNSITPVQNEYGEKIVDLILNIQQNEFNIDLTIADQPDLLDIGNIYYRNGGCFWGAFIPIARPIISRSHFCN
ncbi:hypothetical protein [Pedobacter sp. L105]|uniref:hypothetical protein n=1 Tax=Pedobacter sp. L105 TaxID=1641871 RepID=UPI00131A6BBB|nr:hypothetical protein [Pedobacter sp. L105]